MAKSDHPDTDPNAQAVRWSTSGEPVMVSAEGRESLRNITMSARQRRERTLARIAPENDEDTLDV